MQKSSSVSDFDAFHVGKFGSSQGLQKCGRRDTLDTFRGSKGPKRRFLGGPSGSKSIAGAIL